MYRLVSHIPVSEVTTLFCSQFGLTHSEVQNELSLFRQELDVGAAFRKWREETGESATIEKLEHLMKESEDDNYRNARTFRTVKQTLHSKLRSRHFIENSWNFMEYKFFGWFSETLSFKRITVCIFLVTIY